MLFIPGNAGSAHQIRSIASSASRQYYSSPSYMNPYFTSRGLRPLDFFAVDFNEDLSAFHGPTLESERSYTEAAIVYILSKYAPGTKIIVMGHSMGGIVSISLLTTLGASISTVITMSTPHGVPPARFDSRMDGIYAEVEDRIAHDSTPILSICGGITDTMIPSEFCTLPQTGNDAVFRKTVFTSSLEGCWSGVGHREMVWCHQVRWRVARATLELGGADTIADKVKVINHWFRDGISLPDPMSDTSSEASELSYERAPEDRPLVIRRPSGSQRYSFKIPTSDKTLNFILYLSQGTVDSVSPSEPLPLRAAVHICQGNPDAPQRICKLFSPSSLKLIPNPNSAKPFPVPRVEGDPASGGVDESDGVVVFVASVPQGDYWISLQIEGDGAKGWAVASLEEVEEFSTDTNALGSFVRESILLYPQIIHFMSLTVSIASALSLKLNSRALYQTVRLPKLLANALLVYRLEPKLSNSCEGMSVSLD